MKTKAIYSGILSIMLFMSFSSEASRRGRGFFRTKAEYRKAMEKLTAIPQTSREYRALEEVLRTFKTNFPELAARWSKKEGKPNIAKEILNHGKKTFVMAINESAGIASKEKAETIEVLSKFTSLSRKEISEILESKNQEAVDQVRQLAIHVKKSPESVNPQTVNTLVELSYNMRNREREAVQRQNYTPAVNVMLSLVRNINDMASSWAATPRNNALKLITAFNKQYKALKVAGLKTSKGLIASALNKALEIAEGIKALRERNARKTEIDILCKQ